MQRNVGSFRDPSSVVFEHDGRILRWFSPERAEEVGTFIRSEVAQALREEGWIQGWTELAQHALPDGARAGLWLEHQRLPLISYPYEWPFTLLAHCAERQLSLLLRLLEHGWFLSDASAYNFQFDGVAPVFIDLGSVRRYREGEIWQAHSQYLAHFLCPLVLQAATGIEYNPWLRSSLEGIPVTELAKILPLRWKLKWQVLVNIVLNARLQNGQSAASSETVARAAVKKLPKGTLVTMLEGLRHFVAKLGANRKRSSVWVDYTRFRTYNDADLAAKQAFVEECVSASSPALVLDLGCNTGEFTEIALRAGARRAVAVDLDLAALDAAAARARQASLPLTPLYQNAANPSPSQGWLGRERPAMAERLEPDFLLALAVFHHIVIGANAPLGEAVRFLVGLAPSGVIEWVEKQDSTVRRMLAAREDVFPNYTREAFEQHLSRVARIQRSLVLPSEGRTLYHYVRTSADQLPDA